MDDFMYRYSLTFLVSLASFFATGSLATASDFCVGSHPNCPVGATVYTNPTAGNLMTALTAASDDSEAASRVYLGAGLYDAGDVDSTDSFALPAFDHEVDVIGAGTDDTVIYRNTTNSVHPVVDLEFSGRASSLSALRVHQNGDSNNASAAARIAGGSVDHVDLKASFSIPGKELTVARLEDVDVTDSRIEGNSSTALEVGGHGSPVTLSNVKLMGDQVDATMGLVTDSDMDAPLVGDRLYVFGYSVAARIKNATSTFSNSVFNAGSIFGNVGLHVTSPGTSAHSLTLDGVTVAGSGNGQTGLVAEVDSSDVGANKDLSVSVNDSMVEFRGTSSIGLKCSDTAASHTATVSLARSVYDFSRVSNAGCGYSPAATEFDSELLPPIFVPGAHEVEQAWNSPWIDSTGVATGAGQLDVAGSPRLVAGKTPFESSGALKDPGAYEYQASIPTLSLDFPQSSFLGDVVNFSAYGSDEDPYEASQLTYQWNFGDGGTATGAYPSHIYASIGSYLVAVTATDPAGRTSTLSQGVATVSARPSPAPPTDTTRPKVRLTSAPGSTTRAKIAFKANEKAALWCNFDKTNRWVKCKSPWKKTVAVGSHKLLLRAIDLAGNVSATVTVKWKVKKRR